jgi:acetolactate synthase-1/2/3 large subunit
MNGAEILIRTALAAGVNVCFANPGTTEMPLVAALDAIDGMRAVLGLFEGVCSGAADGYARMADRPALTLTHLGPGFANSIANLHNARRARSPVVNIIGDQATWHLAADAPLTSDIVSLARPVSSWVRKSASPDAITGETADAIAAAGHAPGHVATLIVPSDCQWSLAADRIASPQIAALPTVGDDAIRKSAELLRRHGAKAALFMGANALRARGLNAAARIAAKCGCRLMCETFPARVERGGAMPAIEKLPYFPEQALESLGKSDAVVLAGALAPVAFFGYPNVPSLMIPEGRECATLAAPYDDAAAALEALAEALGALRGAAAPPAVKRPPLPTGELNAATIGAAIAATMPEGAIVMDEAATTGLPFFGASAGAHRRRDWTGAAVRDRRRGRLSRSQGNRLPGRRQRHVHVAGAVDAGARAPQRHHAHLQQPPLPDSAGGTRARGHHRARPQGAVAHEPRQSRNQLVANGGRNGRTRSACRACRRSGGSVAARAGGAGPEPDRNADLVVGELKTIFFKKLKPQ